jgi:hypothetical protein
MARLRSTVHIYCGMISHSLTRSFKKSFKPTLILSNPSRQLLQCQMLTTIHCDVQPIIDRRTRLHAYVIDQVASTDALRSKVAIATVDNRVHARGPRNIYDN